MKKIPLQAKIIATLSLPFMFPMFFDSPQAQQDLKDGKISIKKEMWKALKLIWTTKEL